MGWGDNFHLKMSVDNQMRGKTQNNRNSHSLLKELQSIIASTLENLFGSFL